MSDYAKKALKIILMAVLFAVFLAMIVIGQKNIGAPGLGLMLLGVAGLVALLWAYNRQFK